MRAVVWRGPRDVRVEDVPDPAIVDARDAVVRVTSTAICGSDLHLYNGYIAGMRSGDILGHEAMGIVEAVGPGVGDALRPGMRVVVAAPIACGGCWHCRRGLFSMCDNGNPNAAVAEAMLGYGAAGIFGYSHLFGGYAGGQAELLRVPFADVGCFPVPDALSDERVLFLSDVFSTGWMAAEQCGITEGDVVAVWGCGAVGQFAIRAALLLGAAQVVAIDRVPARLELARLAGAVTIDDRLDVVEELKSLTAGRGPDACIDAVGMEAHGRGLMDLYDRTRMALRVTTDRVTVLREAIQACRKGGVVSVAGVYAGWPDKVPMGAVMNKGLTIRSGQVHAQRYMAPLLGLIEEGRIDPAGIVSHRLPLDAAPDAYRAFDAKADGWIKVVLKPGE